MTAKFACAICGKKQAADQMVYSRFTKNHYCAYNETACKMRAKRRRARAARPT